VWRRGRVLYPTGKGSRSSKKERQQEAEFDEAINRDLPKEITDNMLSTEILKTRATKFAIAAALLVAMALTLSANPAEAVCQDPPCTTIHLAPTVDVDDRSVTVNEGQAATNTGTFDDSEDDDADSVTITASVGAITQSGSGSGTWSWAYTTTEDGPGQGKTVTITARDSTGRSSSTSFALAVNNAPPTASFSPPSSVSEGTSITLSLTNADDPSSADDAAGFTYAFDCGDAFGYQSPDTQASREATRFCGGADGTSESTRTVKAKLRDKDGGETEYTKSIIVNNVAPTATFNAPDSVKPGSLFEISLTNPNDPSVQDQGNLKYALDCGSGYTAPDIANTNSCTAGSGTSQVVRGKIIDDDGGETEYTKTVALNSAPVVSGMAPTKTKDTTPLISAAITDGQSTLSSDNIKLYVDGKEITGFTYSGTRLSYQSGKLKPGKHKVKIVATDPQGLSTTKEWNLTILNKK
jgi:hypothetical protein